MHFVCRPPAKNAVYRDDSGDLQFAAHVTVPGVDRDALDQLFSGDQAGFLNVLNLLSGGAVSNSA